VNRSRRLLVLDAIQVVDLPARTVAVIRLKAALAELPKVMPSAIDEVFATLTAQGVTPAGPLFNHFFSMDSGVFDFEVGVPVESPVVASGRVVTGQLPEVKVVKTTYHGPYTGLHNARGEFGGLARAQGYKPAKGIREYYVYGPESNPDPSTWRTELVQPLAD
jgi:effector-binding domain-containing protein